MKWQRPIRKPEAQAQPLRLHRTTQQTAKFASIAEMF
ncbi:MAG: hypothetical protein ACI92A_002714 [Candidatus Paceibacteria bacterium]|jgi:hypothetical protein